MTKDHLVRVLNAILELELAYVTFVSTGGPFGAAGCRKWGARLMLHLQEAFVYELPGDSQPSESMSFTHWMLKRFLESKDLETGAASGPALSWVRTFLELIRSEVQRLLGLSEADRVSAKVTPSARLSALDIQVRPSFPPVIYENVETPFLAEAVNREHSIAVVCDLRKSTYLLTHETEPGAFIDLMTSFVEEARGLVLQHGGMFDKFTGDGFLAYFFPEVVELVRREHVLRTEGYYSPCDPMQKPINTCTAFCSFIPPLRAMLDRYMNLWERRVKSVPTDWGFGVGADYGRSHIRWPNGYPVAIGSPIVMASRLSHKPKANEVVINYPLKLLMVDSGMGGLVRQEISAQPESDGLSIRAWAAF